MHRPRHLFAPAFVATLAVAAASAICPSEASAQKGTGQITGQVYARERADHQQSLLVDIHGGTFDEVVLDPPRRLKNKGRVGYISSDWKWEADGALRFRGPAATSLRARIDYDPGTKLPHHLPVKVRFRGLPVYNDRIDVTMQPALKNPAQIGDVLTLPGRLEIGRPFTFQTSLPDPQNLEIRLIPADNSQPLKLGPTVRLSGDTLLNLGVRYQGSSKKPVNDTSLSEVYALGRPIKKATVRDGWGELVAEGKIDISIWPEIASTAYGVDWANFTPKPGLTYSLGDEGEVLLKSRYAQYADQLLPEPEAGPGSSGDSYASARDDSDSAKNTGEFNLYVDSYACLGFQDDNGNGAWDHGELALPYVPATSPTNRIGPGIGVEFKGPIVKDKLWWFGSWPIKDVRKGSRRGDTSSASNTDAAAVTRPRFGSVCGKLEDLLKGRPIVTDRHGRVRALGVSEAPIAAEEIEQLPPRSILPLLKLQPGVIQAPEMGLVGENYCVCGDVPNIAAWSGLRIGDRPLGPPLAASAHSATFQLPADLPSGAQSVNWVNVQDGQGSGSKTVLLKIEGSIDQTKLLRGEATELQLRIRGTEKQLPFQLENFTPTIVSLEGGDRQTATTSGGSDNVVRRQVQAVSPGNFNIQYEFNLGKCTCSAPPSSEVRDKARTTREELVRIAGEAHDQGEGKFSAAVVNDRDRDVTPAGPESSLPFDCSINDRFRVRVDWSTPDGEYGRGRCAPAAAGDNPDTARFHFLDPQSTDLMVEVLNQCEINNRFWVLYRSTTDVRYNITVTDPVSGQTRHWRSPMNGQTPVEDTQAFATCPR